MLSHCPHPEIRYLIYSGTETVPRLPRDNIEDLYIEIMILLSQKNTTSQVRKAKVARK